MTRATPKSRAPAAAARPKRAPSPRGGTLPAPAAEPKLEGKTKLKLIRDSFTMPREDFDLIAQLKARALEFKRPAKKSELLRAGLQALAAYDNARLKGALDSLRVLKAGRPKKK